MADSGKILEQDITEKKVYEVGQKIADSLKPASKEIDVLKSNWLNAMIDIKQSIFDLDNAQKSFKTSKGFKEFLENKKKQTIAVEKGNKATKDEIVITEQIAVAYKEQDRAEKNLITTIERKKLATESTVKALTKERYELQQLNKRAKQAAILSSSLSTEYEKQSVRLTILRTKYKDVALTQGYNSKEAKKLRNEIKKLDTTLKKVDAHVGQYQRSVGNYGKAMQSAAGAARTMMSAMGFVGGAYLFVNVIRDAFNRVREFDKSMQNLAGVLRTTREELKPLEADIIKVAGASIKTSREVAGLAETLATLGKSPEQIQKLLKPVVDLGIGLEATGEEAGEFLIQMLNAFGASEDEALKYADTIATIRTSTTLDFQKMRDSFQYIAPISRILNKDLAYTGAVVGILADNGLKAESAGRLLATGIQKLAKEGKTLDDALDEINEAQARGVKETDLLALATKLFDKQAAKVGITLANNKEKIDANAQSIRENGGALNDLVNEQLNSLDAKLKILDSSWEELILTIENGKGTIANAYKGFIETITFAIQRTTELEKAQGRVFEITGKDGDGWGRKILTTILPPLQLINSEYDELVEKQQEFNKTNENIDANGLLILEGMYQRINKEIDTNTDLTDNEIKLYKKQSEVIQSAINKKKDQRKELEKEAIALGFNKKELGKYADEIRLYTDGDLKKFISENKKLTDVIKEETEAERKARLEREKNNKAIEARLKLLADDKFNYEKAQLESEIKTNKEILENENKTLSEKQLANQRYFDLKSQLLKLQRDKELEEAKDRTDKLAEIQLKYNDDYKALEKEKETNSLAILKKQFEQELKIIKEAEQKKKEAQNKEIGNAQDKLKKSAQTPEDVEVYEKEIAEIKKRYALETVQAQINAIEDLLAKEGFTTEQRKILAEQLKDLKIQYSNIETDQIIANNEKLRESDEKLAEFKRNMFSQFSEGLGEALNINSQSLNDFFNSLDGLFDKSKDGVTEVLQTISAAASVTRNVLASVYQANIEELQAQLDASNEYYDTAYERAEGNKVQQDLIREEQKKKEKKIKKEIAKEKTKAAKADKAAAIVQAGINTALAVTSALATQPFLPLGPIMAALAGTLGLAQIALIASKPIPKFKDGVRNFEGGLAWLGDGGVSEIYRTPDGKVGKTPNTDTLYNLPKGTDVYRSEDEYKQLMRASILASVEIDNKKLKKHQAEQAFEKHRVNDKAIEEAIANGFKKQKVHFHTTNKNNVKVDLNYALWRAKNLNRE